ncbi:putative PurR-regulated permease PerM [Arcanobacterium pluranimalium]|uniref:AI-2E family transporter n=1 Tax=Arcanobacterium pluranimalium TaxID=108028 RepID=UPI00195AFCE3|nr:AI-2E family transporter [Arcanobacterium pluranimalium]MBM7825256.1 putative PurR-regulated permease PerM [Arcanobacterium pluranimalium]
MDEAQEQPSENPRTDSAAKTSFEHVEHTSDLEIITAPDDVPEFPGGLVTVPAGASRVTAEVRTAAAWSWRILVIGAAVYAASWMFITFSTLLISLLVSLLMAVIAEPVSSWLKKKLGFPPAAAAAATVFGLFLILAGIVAGSGTGLYQGFSDLGSNLEEGISSIVHSLNDTFPNAQDQISQAWSSLQETLKQNSGQIAGGVMMLGSSITEFITGAVLVLFTLFFFLKDGREIWQWFVRLLPIPYRTNANEAGIRAWVTIGNYTRTQAIVAFVDALGIATIAVLFSTPLPLAFPIGALVFLGAFVPIVGAFLSGAVAVLVVLVNSGSIWMALGMLLGVLVVQQIEGNILQPILQGNALNMHALAVVFVVAAGSAMAGIVGALFSVPIAAALNTAVLYLKGHDTFPYLDEWEDRPGGPRRDFESYTAEFWHHFDTKVAQHLSPKEKRAVKRAKLPKQTSTQ